MNHRNRSTSYFAKRYKSNTRTYSRIKATQEKIKLKTIPLSISATSWIVVTPNAFKSVENSIQVSKREAKHIPNRSQMSRKPTSGVASSLLGKDCESIMHGNNWSK